jgi:hypothetical protein
MSPLKHGHRGPKRTPEYRAWDAMKTRCYCPSTIRFERWGGRGITVCDRWKNSFENFLADMGPKPSSRHSLDRYPNKDGNYEPGNCRWATNSQQIRNSSKFRALSLNGETLTMEEWSKRLGATHSVVATRIFRGWTVEEALTIPIGKRRWR